MRTGFAIAALLACACSELQAMAEYPSLLFRRADFEELRARASTEPWKTMKELALETSATRVFDPTADVLSRTEDMKAIVSANALLYILDPANQSVYVQKIRDTLLQWPSITGDPAALDPDHDYTVGGGSAFFNSVLALDVIHDDLLIPELIAIETELQVMADWFEDFGLDSWSTNGYGCLVVWAAYKRDRELLDQAKGKYREELFDLLQPSGVYNSAPQYAKARTASDRDAKVYTMDVLDFTGEDDYYGDPQLRGLYEWLYGGGTSATRVNAIFGDSSPRRKVDVGPRTFNMEKFSDLAAGHATWVLNGATRYEGELLYYVLMEQQLPPAIKPSSRIWSDSYAAFWEDRDGDESMMVALSSIENNSGDHSHKDVNAIFMSAYGESVLLNSGYAGWQKGLDFDGDGIEEYSWSWIHDNARSSNTVAINRRDHVSKQGGGIAEGLIADRFDYASGFSGPALATGEHWRNLCFVHPRDGKNGYVVLFDEFLTSEGENTFLFLHPDSATAVEDVPNTLFTFTIERRRTMPTYLSVLLATPPVMATLENGGLAIGKDSFDGVFIDAEFEGSPTNHVNVVSVLFPHDATHAPADLSPVSGENYTGALIDHGDSVLDVALESDGSGPVHFGATSFAGKATLFREIAATQTFYFVRQGTRFEDGAFESVGFSADEPVSIFMNATTGRMLSGVNEVTFFYPDIESVLLNGAVAPEIASGQGWITIEIKAQVEDGQVHAVELVTD